MRRLSLGVLIAVSALAACKPADRAQTPAGAVDSSSANLAESPPPVITDSHTIYEARNFRAGPFWTIEIFGQGIRYRWDGNRQGVMFGAGRVEGDDSLSVWTAKRNSSDPPRSLQLQILRLNCSDGPNGIVSDYSVALIVDGKAFQGCADRGTAARRAARDSAAARRRP